MPSAVIDGIATRHDLPGAQDRGGAPAARTDDATKSRAPQFFHKIIA